MHNTVKRGLIQPTDRRGAWSRFLEAKGPLSLGRTALVCSPAFQRTPGGGLHLPCALGMKTVGKASSLVSLALRREGLICKLPGTQKGKCTEVMPVLNGGKPSTSKKSFLSLLKKSAQFSYVCTEHSHLRERLPVKHECTSCAFKIISQNRIP